MPRKSDTRIEKAKVLYLAGMKLIEIAKELDVPEGTVRSWKNRYKWDCNVANNKCNVANKTQKTQRRKKAKSDVVEEVVQNTELTDKQQLFCIYYVRCFNATKAYQKAYGVDYATAASISYRLLENDGVKSEIMRLKKNRLNREMLSEEDIVQRYIDIAYADINDYMSVKDGDITLKNSDEFDGMLVKKIAAGKTKSIELQDSLKALKWLADHMDLATEEQRLKIEKLKESRNIHTDKNNTDNVVLAAGGGKTFGLLMEPIRYKNNSEYGAVIFRKNYTQVTAQGGLWDSSRKLYRYVKGATSLKMPKLHWKFPKGAKVTFAQLENDDDCESWQGTQIDMIGFDELTHFTKYQFFYMLSRNRSNSGVSPYVRATCNPDADSWVAEFISWWINQETGYAIPERSGKIRWMVNISEIISWFDNKEEAVWFAKENGLEEEEANVAPKSVTFIASTLQDNQELIKANPTYLANLLALPEVEKERLLRGNWKIKPAAGLYYKRTQVNMLENLPTNVILWARGWDLAATSEDEKGEPAYTASVLIGKTKEGRYIIADVINKRLKASEVRKLIHITCKMDKAKYGRVIERLPQDPGQAGKEQAQSYIKMLAGYLVKAIPESGSKQARAEPLAAQWQAGNVDVLIADWNDAYFNQLESFPESKFKDMVDASSSAFNEIENGATYSMPPINDNLSKNSYWR